MTVVEIDLSTEETDYPVTSQLDGVSYTLEMRWQVRNQDWKCSISDPDGAVVAGLRMSADEVLAGGITNGRLPPGTLLVADLDGEGDPGRTGFSTPGRVSLLYGDEDQVETITAQESTNFMTVRHL